MFDLADKRLLWIPVRWPGVRANAEGAAENCTHEIECQVELVDRERLKEVLSAESKLSELEKFRALAHDWRKVKMGKASAPMTDENIALFLKVPNFASGFEASYLDAWRGQIPEREKNSDASPKPGPADEAEAA